MFYPVDSLKRGGRFYMCWVADSWPHRFATITHRQLWSQDIRKLCDDLLEVMMNESGRPANRFSLRLSSQLMRGLVRFYERKVSVFLNDLCMLNAHVLKLANKKYVVRNASVGNIERALPQLPPAAVIEEPEVEQRVEEMIQNSSNAVRNIQDITLKEAAIPDFQLPPNDGFGEENPEQALQQLLGERSVEMMMRQDVSAAQHSGLELPLDMTVAEGSHDKSRAPHAQLQMERISEHDVTMFRKSIIEPPAGDFEKDIPEIPEIPPPDLPAPLPDIQVTEPQGKVLEKDIPVLPQDVEKTAKPAEKEPVEIELEELEQQPPARKRRARNKLIIDKKIKLSAGFLRPRIDNLYVELRCEDSSEDVVDVRVPAEVYLRRAAHAGERLGAQIGDALARLFARNLGVVPGARPLLDSEPEDVIAVRTRQRHTTPVLEKIIEEPQPEMPQVQPQMELPIEENISKEILNLDPGEIPNVPQEISNLDLQVSNLEAQERQVNVLEPMNISDLPTQVLETLSQEARKRTSEYETSPKRQRLNRDVPLRESQQAPKEITIPVINEPDKENIPPNIIESEVESARATARTVTSMLQEAGLADIQPAPETEVVAESQAKTRRGDSESSETPLGSLDRTKVSLGDTVVSTDTQRFIRNQWGIEGTMMKILAGMKAGMRPVTVDSLIEKGPVRPGYRSIIAARCFSSILKLKQHAFVKILKDPDTLEIRDITLGPRFDVID